jgi:hypothetical protein
LSIPKKLQYAQGWTATFSVAIRPTIDSRPHVICVSVFQVAERSRLALPTGAYFTWNGTALEGSPIEPDVIADFDWQERRSGVDAQLLKALSIAG